MHKRLVNQSILQSTINDSIEIWFSQLSRWNKARKLRKAAKKRADVMSELNAHILYDIGENDCRPQQSKMPIWDNNPYRLVIEAILHREPVGFDPRR